MKPSKNCIDLIKQFEGLYLKSYRCPAGFLTIGYGSRWYENGKDVKDGEVISMKRAEDLLLFELEKICRVLPKLDLNQNQFDAVVSFCFNLGVGNFLKSTMYKIMKVNPDDPLIGNEFMKWTRAKVNGETKVLKGLVRRRQAEKNLYFHE